ncbi:MAG: HEAT repeat domain-containing protein [Ignavibacteria bacterium]|jgi:HEAT repeat protein|nr:HEAT repeat domain-containing protein [Ignavibacteria bacterium]
MTFEELIDVFQNAPSPEDRRLAADELKSDSLINDIAIKAFANGLMDSDIGIRDVCQRALLDTPEHLKSVTASAVAPYINMRDIELRNLAGEVLTRVGAVAVPILLPYLKSTDFDVRKFACDILGLIADASIAPYVIPLLSDTDRNVQLSAVETLGNLQASTALDALIMVYENFDEIKPAVIESIGKIGGDNSESYLLEQLDNETDMFLQTTIIDALSFNAKSIDISYKLLAKMPNSDAEMQKIMLMTAFAISFRLEENLLMPDELRYVSYRGMAERDENIMIASLISLGDVYRRDDVPSLVTVVAKENPDLNYQILYNITINSDVEVIAHFFEQLFAWEETTGINTDLLDNLTNFWDSIPFDNRDAIISALLYHFELSGSMRILSIFAILYSLDSDLVSTKLLEYSLETSKENKLLIDEFLKQHEA